MGGEKTEEAHHARVRSAGIAGDDHGRSCCGRRRQLPSAAALPPLPLARSGSHGGERTPFTPVALLCAEYFL